MSKLDAALAYGRMGWRIFPCHSIVQTPAGPACSCGKACGSEGKHPRIKQGFRGADNDALQIKRWWTRYPDANIGLATGSGLAVFDIDGAAGFAEFKALVQANGPVPDTLVQETGRGVHLVFATPDHGPEVRSSARGNVHVRGEGGYIIVAPSDHISGKKYQWIKKVRLGTLPNWLRQWSQGYEISGNAVARHRDGGGFEGFGTLPVYLQEKQKDITTTASDALKTAYSPSEHARLADALKAIPSVNYEIWYQVGMALKTLDWERSDGTDIGLELFDSWSALCPEKYSQAACETKWRSFGRRAGITLGTVYHLAREHGWSGGLPFPGDVRPPGASPVGTHHAGGGHLNGHANGVNGNHALPAAFLNAPEAIFFPDRTEEGKVKATMTNAKVAISALGVDCRYDLFHNRMLVAGELISKWTSAQLSDPVITVLRDHIRYKFQFDPGKQQVQDAAETLCLNHMFDPVLDYLDALQWDGTPRLDSWLASYLGAGLNDYTRAVSRLSLIAAVRRARQPGTKFDQIIVLEGRQGVGKSEAIRIMAGDENFSDQKILGVDDRKQQELTEGVWLYEIAELTGLRKTEIEHVKAFVSRQVDRARPAYGRYMVSQPRRTVFFGSTNPGQPYLQDETGNRRFWAVTVGRINLDSLARDRDQLWAEASMREAGSESHVLPERLWGVAAELAAERTEVDEWTDLIANYVALKALDNVSIMQVLTDNQYLRLEAKEIGQQQQNRAARVLRGLGWERYRGAPESDGRRPWRYRKPV